MEFLTGTRVMDHPFVGLDVAKDHLDTQGLLPR
jgi:hypothetical protein